MLYSNLPDEAQLLLCYPEVLSKQHNSKSYFSDMKGFVFKTHELDKCISLFYHFSPELKKEYKQFFSSLSSIRNVSVHASVPDFQKYELDRLAYFSSRLFQLIAESKLFKYFHFKIDDKTEGFIKYYEDEKIKKVKSALDAARDVIKKGKLSEIDYYSGDWDTMQATCPVCGNTFAAYYGETEESRDSDGIILEFECESFTCESCDLELEDYEELVLANMETSLERDEEDTQKWITENDYYDDDERW
ncbi:MAG: hypothetical protein L3J52_01615 [Proteobacteria bacterium]|nr:hypothetical protein [Pseudomonadota bacterium]